MAKPQPVDPVKLLVGVLWADAAARDAALAQLQATWGTPDYQGPDRAFDQTHYYDAEMGPGLQRRLIAFAELVPPESLPAAKLRCNAIEDGLAHAAGRRVNLDVGYLDRSKVVLASVKYAGQKIHLGAGVYADLIARYEHGRYQPFPWTFPDFRDGRYDAELQALRTRYLDQLRQRRRGPVSACAESGTRS